MARLRVKEIAEAQGFNAASLSRAANIGYTTVYNLWNNPDHPANMDTLKAIAKALKVKVTDLIEDEAGDVPEQSKNSTA